MVKVRLVALGTFVAASALVFGLSALKKRAINAPSPAASASASASASVAVIGSALAPIASQTAIEAQPVNLAAGKDYALMADGTPVPPLPSSAPRVCGFGAILFTYEGAQFAPRKARSKLEAYTLASNLIAKAGENFAEAVKQGDPGSLADAGSLGRGILERAVEYRLFTLEKGQIDPAPVETPRGYWVLKRLR